MQTGYIFNYFGQPWLTQKWVREVIQNVYSDNDLNMDTVEMRIKA